MKNDLVFIEHILDSIDTIEKFSKNINKVKFILDRLKHDAIIREIEIIGEAVKNISENLKNRHQEVKWKEIAGTRDHIIHHYFGVDMNIVWDIVKINLPDLKVKVTKIKNELKNR